MTRIKYYYVEYERACASECTLGALCCMQREIDDRWVVRKLIILVGRICEKMCVEIFRLLGGNEGTM